MTACLLGVLARCLVLFEVQLHAFVFLSNHGHVLASVANAWHATSFVRHFKSRTAVEVQRLTGWNKQVWVERTRPVPILDDLASIDRLRYVFSNGVKEGLVDHPLEWPGASSASALLEGTPIVAPPFHRRPKSRRLPANAAREQTDDTPQLVQLAPLPVWAGCSPQLRQSLVRELVVNVVERAVIDRAGRPSLGQRKILDADPFAPKELEERPPPIAHYTDVRAFHAFKAERAAFSASFRGAGSRLRDTPPPVEFPAGAFLPSQGFVEE